MPAALIAYFHGMSSLGSAIGSLGPGFAAALLAFAGVSTAGVAGAGAGADGAGKTGKALGGRTVGVRAAQPGTLLLRSTHANNFNYRAGRTTSLAP